MQYPTYKNELVYLQKGYSFAAGCDEVGVGPVAGPVVAAACVLRPESIGTRRSKHKWYSRVRDSKTVKESELQKLAEEIKKNCYCYGVGIVDAPTIDRINIHRATLFAMKLATEEMLSKLPGDNLKPCGEVILFVDGRFIIKDLAQDSYTIRQQSIIDGDALILSVSAASIIAKVHRDNILREQDLIAPSYGFAKHKGYNTKEHIKAIIENGITEFHRKSFLNKFISI
ncbi:MAG: hypothetical protein NVSMB66_3340 [Candidatus Doudnabacteria bacterium]